MRFPFESTWFERMWLDEGEGIGADSGHGQPFYVFLFYARIRPTDGVSVRDASPGTRVDVIGEGWSICLLS